jgi:hypothetical protein
VSAVERRFPAAAAFLAAERGEGPAPVVWSGETQNVHDDQPAPHVLARVDYRLSRWELFAALAAGYATTNSGADPDEMTVAQIRYDVEAQLALMSWREMEGLVEEVAGEIERGEHLEHMQALKRAMDRAYPPVTRREEIPADLRELRRPRAGGNTITVNTVDYGPVELPEPHWCVDVHPDGEYRADIVHYGEEIALVTDTTCHGQVQVLTAALYQGPFSERATRDVVAAVEFGDPEMGDGHSLNAAELAGLADALVSFAVGPLHQLIERLQLLEGGES